MKYINLRAPYNSISGYKRILDTLLFELPKKDFDIAPIPTGEIAEKYEHLFNDTREYNMKQTELFLCPLINTTEIFHPLFRLNKHPNRILFTMWESTNISFQVVDELNKMAKIIVPSEWNRKNFKRCGVYVPIEVCPLFVDTSIFKYYHRNDRDDIFVFGTANNDPRKKLENVIKCFFKAFPKEKNVKLKIKLSENNGEDFKYLDSRIQIDDEHMFFDTEMSNWYNSIRVFVSGVTAEGWGLHQQESMACGAPLIAPKYAGLTEFFTDENGYPINYTEVPSTDYWKVPGGKWSQFDIDDMINKMRYCYNNRNDVWKKSLIASKNAMEFNIDRFINTLIRYLL